MRKANLLDTPPEEYLDRLTRLAAEAMSVPAAFLSLVDDCGDFFYKRLFCFVETRETTSRLSGETFRNHALVSDGLVIIDDARRDRRYPVARTIETAGVAAYLGVPLDSAGGQRLGMLCLVDTQPHRWTNHEVTTACLLARAALREIELRTRSEKTAAVDVPKLSPREREIMLRLVAGQRPKEIASDLELSVQTVATHRLRLFRKLKLEDNRDLYRYALGQGLLDWTSVSD